MIQAFVSELCYNCCATLYDFHFVEETTPIQSDEKKPVCENCEHTGHFSGYFSVFSFKVIR